MQFLQVLLFTVLSAFIASPALAAPGDDGSLVVQNIAEIETVVVDKAGRKTTKREPVAVAVPGTEVIYTTRFTNKSDKPAGDIVLTNPVPEHTRFVGGSAFGLKTTVTYSIDGKHFDVPAKLRVTGADGKERAALPEEYTHVRWRYAGELAPGKQGDVGFRVVIK